MKQSKIISIIGMPGSGKTSLGKKIAKRLKLPFIDSDAEIEKEFGKKIPDIFKEFGEQEFRKKETEVIEREIAKGIPCVLSTGGGAVLRNAEILKEKTFVIYLKKNIYKIYSDMKAGSRPLIKTKEDIRKIYYERKELYEKTADIMVSYKKKLFEVLEKIGEKNENYYFEWPES
jgi:shikimate kinase